MNIALIQHNPVIGDFGGNVERLLEAIGDAASAGADVAVCGELAIPGYPPRDLLDYPAFIDGNLAALDRLASAAPIPTIAGFVDRGSAERRESSEPGGVRPPALYNAAAVIEGGQVRSVHRKTLLPTYDVFDEWRYFAPGRDLSLAKIGGVAFGVSICEDIWNDADFWPHRRYRRDPVAELAALGAQVLVNISASPYAIHKRSLRVRMLAAQARKHRLPLVMVNQVGGNDDLVFDGGSIAIAADGQVGARAHLFAPDVVVADVDIATGACRGPIRDIHLDTEDGDIAAALDALVLGTRDYVRKCGFGSALVGLSGGIDSALTACIAARALGADRVTGVSMPSRYSSDHSRTDARALAEALGIEYLSVPIEGVFAAALESLAPAFAGAEPGVAEENLQARARAIVLMALSNKRGHLLLTTGNKSELAVGYCTLYGDMSGGLAVISDVPKTMVYALSEEVNRQAGRDLIPRSTIEKPPSAELRPDQTDQDSLPPYEVLDAILERAIEAHQSRDDIVGAGFDAEVVDHVLSLVRRSEYKRSQAALGLKIRDKTFGPGRRMPLAARWRG